MLQTHLPLVRKLIERFIEHPTELCITTTAHHGSTTWRMRCHQHDHGKLTGKAGSHFHALRLLINYLGKSAGTRYVLIRYDEPMPASPRPKDRPFLVTPTAYDLRPMVTLLTEILENLDVGQFTIEHNLASTEHTLPLTYIITVTTRDPEDYNELTIANLEETTPSNADAPMTLIGAIGTIFRAYANREGIRLSIKVARHG